MSERAFIILLSHHKILVRYLSSVELLRSGTLIATDKTGTVNITDHRKRYCRRSWDDIKRGSDLAGRRD
ncbi:MAG TPA: hypothetical protein VFX57_02825 [Sulfuricurvum sp.]|nr:hypothetical protein [Sulfuricurvum sp.]